MIQGPERTPRRHLRDQGIYKGEREEGEMEVHTNLLSQLLRLILGLAAETSRICKSIFLKLKETINMYVYGRLNQEIKRVERRRRFGRDFIPSRLTPSA